MRHLNCIRTLLTLEGLSGIELLRNDWTKILKVVAGGAPTGGDQRARRCGLYLKCDGVRLIGADDLACFKWLVSTS